MDLLLEKFSATHFSDYLKLVSNSDVMAMITERAVPAMRPPVISNAYSTTMPRTPI